MSTYFHDLNYDVFIFSMPLKGVNLGPGSTDDKINDNHWWFFQWEQKGDRPIRYFVEPVILTANYALSKLGYENIFMAGLSGVVGPRRLPLRSIHESKQAFRLLEVYLVQ